MPKEQGQKVVATNRKARHDYNIIDTYECGVVLWGTEVKSLRQGRASLTDGYAFIEGGEAWLDAVHIPEYTQGTWNNHAPRRKRKLLMHKQEILKLHNKVKE
ncbi:MAG: SsrA-binding protein SmpB, partial [Aurantimicrobium sp.]